MNKLKKLEKYPIINVDPNNLDKINLAKQVRDYLTEYNFFYINDFFKLRNHLDDTLLKKLPGTSIDSIYGEDAYSEDSSEFHGTYIRFQNGEDNRFDDYFELFTILQSIISLALNEKDDFLSSFSKEQNYSMYIYEREKSYLDLLSKLEKDEISIPPHVDKSLITVIVSIKGFEGYSLIEKEWITLPDKEGYLIVQGGTLLHKKTEGRIKAHIHRVKAEDSSKAIFWGFLHPR